MPARTWLRACCPTPLHLCGQSFVCKEIRVRMRAFCERLGVLFAVPEHILSPFVNHDAHNLVSRNILSTRCHATSTFCYKYPSNGTWPAVHLFSQSHVNQMPHIWHRDKGCRVVRLRGEARQVCVNVLEFFSLPREGKCHFDAHLLEATCCQVVAKTVKTLWTPLFESIWCHGVLDDFVPQLNVWCCLSQALRQSAAALRFSHCAILSNMRRKWHAGNAILVAFFYTVSNVKLLHVCVCVNATYEDDP